MTARKRDKAKESEGTGDSKAIEAQETVESTVTGFPIVGIGASAGGGGILIDITKQKQVEEALRRAEESFRRSLDDSPMGVRIVTEEGETIYANRAILDIYGYDGIEELKTTPIKKRYTPQSYAAFRIRKKKRRQSDDAPSEYEISIVRKSGEIRHLQVYRKSVLWDGERQFQIIYQDITKRKQAEEALKKSEEKYRSILDNMDDMYYELDLKGNLTFFNKASISKIGYSREELMGMNYRQYVAPEAFDRMSGIFSEIYKTCKPVRLFEYEVITKNGQRRHFESWATILLNENKKPIGFRGIARDFTERKRLEFQFIQAQKMEALGTLSSGIAHDFNNILASMIGYTELAMMAPDEERRQSDMEQILHACDRATKLVTQILTFSRVTSQEHKPMEMGPIVKEALKLLRASLPTTIEIRRKIASEPGIISGNPTQLHQVLMNLCTNAAHAIGENGGILEVRLSPVEVLSEERSPSPCLQAGSYMMLTVSDTGHGVDPAIMDRIFDPFFTTKPAGEGTGLGLSVVYGIAKAHGGEITVQSEPGKGSAFSVYFPRVQARVKPERESLKSLPKGSERILFVDDEAELVQMGRMMLETLGYEVMSFTNSALACRAFVSHPDRFDLVITDMTMPVMTGVALSREILKIRPEIPIILCTGHSEFINEKKAKETGIREFLMKPVFVKDLARVVREVLDGRTGEKQLFFAKPSFVNF